MSASRLSKIKLLFVDGYIKPEFELVKEVFRQNLEKNIEYGGTCAAYYKDELVVNLWGGAADLEARIPWRQYMYPCFYSTTKSLCSVVIAHLVESGALSYSEKVVKYWPEFGQNGKENITLEQLVSNQAGLSAVGELFELKLMKTDPEKLGKILARQKPLWKPGTNHGYHPLTFALYLDQIVRKVDHKKRSLGDYFREEIAVPFGLDMYIGLPKEEFYRAPRVFMKGKFDSANYIATFKGDLDILRMTAANPTDFKSVLCMNDPDIRELQIGSICGHGTAEAMAKFHGILANGGTLNGRKLLSRKTIELFETIKVAGFDLAFSMDCMWSMGTMVNPVFEGNKEMIVFGHGGYGGQMGLADTHYKVGFAYATNHLDPTSRAGADADMRWPSLYDAVYKCIHQIENVTVDRVICYQYEDYKKMKKKDEAFSRL